MVCTATRHPEKSSARAAGLTRGLGEVRRLAVAATDSGSATKPAGILEPELEHPVREGREHLRNNRLDTEIDDAAFVDACKQPISDENQSWMARWNHPGKSA